MVILIILAGVAVTFVWNATEGLLRRAHCLVKRIEAQRGAGVRGHSQSMELATRILESLTGPFSVLADV